MFAAYHSVVTIERILLVGATGMLGRPIARRLVADGWDVAAMVRDPQRARDVLPDGCRLIPGNVLDSASLEAAMSGQDAVYVNLAAPRSVRRPDVERSGVPRIIEAARKTGVGRLLKISFMGVPQAADLWWQIRHKAEAEQAIMDSGIAWTILYPTWFMESIALFRQGRRLVIPRMGDVQVHWISGDDYARQVAAAIRSDRARNRGYVVQGPEPLTFLEASRRFAAACTPPHSVVQIPMWMLRPVAPLVADVRYLLDLLKVTAETNTEFEAGDAWEDLGEPRMTVEDWVGGLASRRDPEHRAPRTIPPLKPDEFISFLNTHKASAILRTTIADAAGPAMEAALRGGFRIIEFTMTTPGALELIGEFSTRAGIVVGAGTVLTPADARAAVEAGARYLVSPVVDEAVIDTARSLGVAMMPGTHTPTEMLRAHRAGGQLQKLFPAPGIGPAFVKACLGPMPFLRIVPTSGVDESNAAAYMRAGAFGVGFVAPLFDPGDVAAGRFDRIEDRAETLLAAVRGAAISA